MALDWLKDIDYREIFPADYVEMIDLIGLENFAKLFSYFGKTPVYFSEAPITLAKKAFILKYGKEKEPRELARKLGVSERYVYKVLRERNIDNKQLDLFDERENK